MDRTRELSGKGMIGDEEAIEALHLSEVNDVEYQKMENITKDMLERLYTLCAKAALSGKCLGIDLLKISAMHVMELTQLLATKELKCSLQYTLDKDEVIKRMSAVCKDRLEWLKVLGEKDGTSALREIEWLADTIAYARQGDKVSLSVLNLIRLPTLKITKLDTIPSYMSLFVDFKRASEVAAFGRYSLDTTLRVVNSVGMSVIEYMVRKFYPDSKSLSPEIDGQDVSSTLYEELRIIKEWLETVKSLHGNVDKMDQDGEDNLEDPSYNPETTSKEDESDDEQPGPSTSGKKKLKSEAKQKPSEKKVKHAESDDTDSEASSSSQPMKEASCSRRRKRSSEETTPGSSNPKKAKPTPSPHQASSKPKQQKGRSHYKKLQCPYCNKEMFDLKRHLRLHASQEEIEEGEVERAVNIAAKKTRRRGPQRSGKKKGIPMKWCPVADCEFVTCHMRKHLANKHRVKAGAYLEGLLKVARRYQGRYEVDNLSTRNSKNKPERPVSPAIPMEVIEKEREVNDSEDEEIASEPSADDDDDEKDEDFRLQEDFFSNPNPKTAHEKLLILFFKWLNTADAGRKKNRNRLQHASHIRTMLEDLEPGGQGINILSADEGQIVWTDWVDVKLLSLKSGTINGYLGTYEKFLQFVVEERVRATEFPPVDDHVRRIFRNIIPKLKGLRKTVDLEGRVETNQRRMDECTYRLRTEDVNMFLCSSIVVYAKKIYANASDKQILSTYEMCEARDYLITLISLKTGTRPGALEHLKIQEYFQANTDPVTGHKVLLVPQPKRQIDGPAPLSLDEELHELFSIYVKHIYPQFPAPRGDTIFLRNDGTSFQHGTINKRLPEFWKKSSVRPDLRVTATNIRKFIVTICNQKKWEGLDIDEEVLRRAMCHSDKVAKTSYLRDNMTAVAAQAMDIIAMCTTGKEVSPQRNVSCEKEAPPKHSLFTSSANPPTSRFSTKLAAEPSSSTSEQTSCKEPSGKRQLSQLQDQLIKEVFEDIITTREPILIDEVRAHMKTVVRLRILLTEEKMVRKVFDRVRYLQYKDRSKQPLSVNDLPQFEAEEMTTEWIDCAESSTSKSSGRMNWSEEETAIIVKHFGNFGKRPNKKEIIEAFDNIDELKPLLNTKGLTRCVDKVKNTYKKQRKAD